MKALLAFFMLTKEGSQKEDILDYLIEAFLRKYFKKNIDFHVILIHYFYKYFNFSYDEILLLLLLFDN
jgi:hypothetical protein